MLLFRQTARHNDCEFSHVISGAGGGGGGGAGGCGGGGGGGSDGDGIVS